MGFQNWMVWEKDKNKIAYLVDLSEFFLQSKGVIILAFIEKKENQR